VYKVRVKPKLKTPFHWDHYFPEDLNLHPHCCVNLKFCKGEVLPVPAMKMYGMLEKV
jgi:hypothetical protein